MADFYMNTSQDQSNNITFNDDHFNNTYFSEYHQQQAIIRVVTCIIIGISLPLNLVAIYSLCFLVRKDDVAPIYVINLLISDLIQLCCFIVWVAEPEDWMMYVIVDYIYSYGLIASVFFMVCVAVERYLVIVYPLWYRFRRPIKSSVVVCIVVWALSFLVYTPTVYFWGQSEFLSIILSVFLLLPLPLFIFFIGGTLKALSASTSVPKYEKRRIVGVLVLVALLYTLLFLPISIWFLAEGFRHDITLMSLSLMFVRFNPLADLALYVFMRKGTIDKLLASVCCCRMDSNDTVSSQV